MKPNNDLLFKNEDKRQKLKEESARIRAMEAAIARISNMPTDRYEEREEFSDYAEIPRSNEYSDIPPCIAELEYGQTSLKKPYR